MTVPGLILLVGAQVYLNQRLADLHLSRPFEVMFHRTMNSFRPVSSDSSPSTMSSTSITAHDRVVTAFREAASVVFPGVSATQRDTVERRKGRFDRSHLIRVKPLPLGSFVMIENVTRSRKDELKT